MSGDRDDIGHGDRVAFRFGCTAERLEGTVTRIGHDKQGRPAAWVQVAGFPSWVHLEPLADLERIPPAVTLLQRLGLAAGRRAAIARGDRVEWRAKWGEGEGVATERLDGPRRVWMVETEGGAVQLVPEADLRIQGAAHA